MLKQIKFYLAGAQVDWMGVISLIIFFAFFVGLLIYVLSLKNDYVDTLKNLPLNQDLDNDINTDEYEKI